MIADMVGGTHVADIGTDHAYLPLYLIQNGICEHVTASDIARGPLARAAETVKGYEDRIDLAVGDGLEAVPEQETDCIVIAGMGGDTIEHIIGTSGWSFREKTLILQPMSKLPELRRWLWEHGFDVVDERLSGDVGTLYRAFKALRRESACPEPWELYAGRILFDMKDPLLVQWLNECIEKLERAVSGMKSADITPPSQFIEALDGLKERRSEIGQSF